MNPIVAVALLAGMAMLLRGQHLSHQREATIMTALDDLQAAEADEESVLTALLTDFDTLTTELANVPASTDNSAEIEAIVAKMKAVQDAARAHIAPPSAS